MRWSLLLKDYDFDILHIPGTTNKIADILSRICKDGEEDASRKIHQAKKKILDKLRGEVSNMEIRTGKVVNMADIATLIHTITTIEDQASALIGHHFPEDEATTDESDETRRQQQHVFMNHICLLYTSPSPRD